MSKFWKLPMPCSRNMAIMRLISSPLSILLCPAQKIMCQKSAIFSWSWRGVIGHTIQPLLHVRLNGGRMIIGWVVTHHDIFIDGRLRFGIEQFLHRGIVALSRFCFDLLPARPKTGSAQKMSHQCNILVSHRPSLPGVRALRPGFARRLPVPTSTAMSQTIHPESDLQPLDSPAGSIRQDNRWPKHVCERPGHVNVESANHSRLKARILAHPLPCQALPVHSIGRQVGGLPAGVGVIRCMSNSIDSGSLRGYASQTNTGNASTDCKPMAW